MCHKYLIQNNLPAINYLKVNKSCLFIFLLSLDENSLVQGLGLKLSGSDDEDNKFAKSEAGMILRDKKMSKHYLETESPVFGRVGLAHVDGLIKNINDSFSKQREFKFFLIFSSGSKESFEKNLDRKIHKDTIIIDARNLDDEDIRNIIFENIMMFIPEDKKTFRNNIITSAKTAPSFFKENKSAMIEEVSIGKFSDWPDITNYFYDKKYNPDIVASVLKMVFSSDDMKKILPNLMSLNNLLESVLVSKRPAINESEHAKLKLLFVELLVREKITLLTLIKMITDLKN